MAICIAITSLCFPAHAIDKENVDVSTENISIFTDISPDDYYFDAINEMAKLGYVSGYGGGIFGPHDTITHAQVLTVLCRLAEIETQEFEEEGVWHSQFTNWAKYNLDIVLEDYNTPASREDIAKYITLMYLIDYENVPEAPFVDTDSKFADVLYNLGVSVGIPNDDGTVRFGGEQNLTRGQACTMLYRLSSIDKPIWEDVKTEDSYYNSLLDYSYYDYLDDFDEESIEPGIHGYKLVWEYMMYNQLNQYQFHVYFDASDDISGDKIRNDVVASRSFASREFVEYACYYNKFSYACRINPANSEGKVRADFIFKFKDDRYNVNGDRNTTDDIKTFENECANIITNLYKSGELKNDMSDLEKAKVLYVYLDKRLQYDTTYSIYTGYGALANNAATCQGYTATYNYLCHLVGIPMTGCGGDGIQRDGTRGYHIWSKVTADGTTYYTDVTWGDPIPDRIGYSNLDWFWKTWDNFPMHEIDEFG